MKTTTFAALSLLAGLATSGARADSRVYASVDFHSGSRVVAPVVTPASPSLFYAPGYAALPGRRLDAPRGYWRDITVRNWVPDRWVMAPGRWGRPVRIIEPGHFVYTTDRVWVEDRRDDFPGHREDRWNR